MLMESHSVWPLAVCAQGGPLRRWTGRIETAYCSAWNPSSLTLVFDNLTPSCLPPPFLFFYFVETGSPYVAHAGLNLVILLPQPPECWDYRRSPPYLASLFYAPVRDPSTVFFGEALVFHHYYQPVPSALEKA
jgi:hypothetical protein